jgi:dienelactone hydrolase
LNYSRFNPTLIARVAAAVLATAAFVALVGSAPAAPAPRGDGADGGGAQGPYAVGELTVTFVDQSRTIHVPHHRTEPRALVTLIRYPAAARNQSAAALQPIPPAPARGPFPLIVFGHGYDVTPAIYSQLLNAWAQAGYVVAAPIFPLTNPHAPGGPDESDIVNQPRDMSFVITQILAASRQDHGILAGLVDPSEIAVAGQSDGGITALAAAYDPPFQDRRVDAAAILSGAELPVKNFSFAKGSPPLLATQGTKDVINTPDNTYQFFAAAPTPKYLLKLIGAPHLGPYTDEQPQLGIVERVTVAFFDLYLKRERDEQAALASAGDVKGVASLTSQL